jgi:hypothetical protein
MTSFNDLNENALSSIINRNQQRGQPLVDGGCEGTNLARA